MPFFLRRFSARILCSLPSWRFVLRPVRNPICVSSTSHMVKPGIKDCEEEREKRRCLVDDSLTLDRSNLGRLAESVTSESGLAQGCTDNDWSTPSIHPKKTWDFPSQLIKSTKVLMATPQGRCLGYHTPEQVSNPEPPDSRPCVLTTTLLGGAQQKLSDFYDGIM